MDHRHVLNVLVAQQRKQDLQHVHLVIQAFLLQQVHLCVLHVRRTHLHKTATQHHELAVSLVQLDFINPVVALSMLVLVRLVKILVIHPHRKFK